MRRDYTLTPDEFARLGGTNPPDDYVPGKMRVIGKTGRTGGMIITGTRGVVPAIQFDSALIWQEVAERCGIKLLSVRWPDPFYPDFTAEEA